MRKIMSEQIKTLFQEHDIKFTAARSSILEVLKETHHPMNYEQIKEKMNITMDKATFYRNIAKFEELGMVHKFEADDRKWYFELSSTTHAHFICEQCHQITCMNVDLGNVEGDVKSIVLKGTCKECRT
jgi:Fur family ferric uptake transcriptional regulator